MAVEVKVHQTVIVECGRCGRRSQPLALDKATAWNEQEDAIHREEDRRARLAELGHVIQTHVIWKDMDGGEEIATCSCGWRDKRSTRVAGDGESHLRDVEQRLAAGRNILRMEVTRGVSEWVARVVSSKSVDDSVRTEFQQVLASRTKS